MRIRTTPARVTWARKHGQKSTGGRSGMPHDVMPHASDETLVAIRRAIVELVGMCYPDVPHSVRYQRRRGGKCVRKHTENAAPLVLTAVDACGVGMTTLRCVRPVCPGLLLLALVYSRRRHLVLDSRWFPMYCCMQASARRTAHNAWWRPMLLHPVQGQLGSEHDSTYSRSSLGGDGFRAQKLSECSLRKHGTLSVRVQCS